MMQGNSFLGSRTGRGRAPGETRPRRKSHRAPLRLRVRLGGNFVASLPAKNFRA
jgi:hypothetical protein